MANKRTSMVLVETACIILFTLFSLVYLILFQTDLLAYCQSLLSDGVTTYSPILGGALITFVALLVRFAVRGLFPKNQTASTALSYLPSALGIAILTSAHPVTNTHMEFGGAIGWSIFILVVVGLLIWLANKIDPFDIDYTKKGWIFRALWINGLAMIFVFLTVAFVGNTNENDHIRLRTESLITKNDLKGAVMLSKDKCEKDTSMLMLRAFAYAKHRQLGTGFFAPFPENTTSDMLFHSATNNLCYLTMDNEHIYSLIGGKPMKGMSAKQTLIKLAEKGKITKTGRQYLLIAYLLDRDLDSFVKYLPKVCEWSDPLPRNFAEALLLYKEMHPRFKTNYDLDDVERLYAPFCKEYKLWKNNSATKADGTRLFWHSLKDDFGDTYWYYYVIGKGWKA